MIVKISPLLIFSFIALMVAVSPRINLGGIDLDGLILQILLLYVIFLNCLKIGHAKYSKRVLLFFALIITIYSIGLMRNLSITGGYRILLFISPFLFIFISADMKTWHIDRRVVFFTLWLSSFYFLFGNWFTFHVVGKGHKLEFIVAGVAISQLLFFMYVYTHSKSSIHVISYFIITAIILLTGGNRVALLILFILPTLPLILKLPKILVLLVAPIVLFGALTVLLALAPIKQKMFYSGEGTIETFYSDPSDVRTNGRLKYFMILSDSIKVQDSLYFGQGANRSSELIAQTVRDQNQPHNDWLRLVHDYGLLMAILYIIFFIKEIYDEKLSLFYRLCIVCMPILMLTGNILMYGVYFGNIAALLRRGR